MRARNWLFIFAAFMLALLPGCGSDEPVLASSGFTAPAVTRTPGGTVMATPSTPVGTPTSEPTTTLSTSPVPARTSSATQAATSSSSITSSTTKPAPPATASLGAIDMTAACRWQYDGGASARNIDRSSKGWQCFDGDSLLGGLELDAWCAQADASYAARPSSADPAGWICIVVD